MNDPKKQALKNMASKKEKEEIRIMTITWNMARKPQNVDFN